MNKKILFMCRNYGDPKSACGICIENLVEEFLHRNYEVWVVSVAKEPLVKLQEAKEIHYYCVREGWFTTFNRKARVSKGLINKIIYKLVYYFRLPHALLYFPVLSKRLECELVNKVTELVKRYNIYYIVGTNSPFEPIKATVEIKQKLKSNIKAVCYHLDPVLLQDNTSRIINKFKYDRSYDAVLKEASVVDLILAQQSTRGLVDVANIEYVDFPLFIKGNKYTDSGVSFSKDFINITYVGTLDESNRNPQYIINLLSKISDKLSKPCMLHIWGFIREAKTLDYIKSYPFVKYHGMADSWMVMDILAKSDILLNISNKQSYSAVPSKIFQMFSIRKPIINVVRHPKDFAKKYFDIYPSVFTIEEYNDKEKLKEALSFIENNIGKTVDLPDSLYQTSTPEFIGDLIVK